MRLRGLIVGGLLGAAATVYASRKRPGAFAWVSSAASDVCARMVGGTVSKIMSRGMASEAAAAAPKPIDASAGNSEDAWEQIEALVNSDPEVKREADKIKAESSALAH